MYKEFSLSRNKRLDIDVGRPYRFIKIIDLAFYWTRNIDHAGIHFLISLFGLFYCEISAYDIRNWNDEKKCFEFRPNNKW